MRNHWLAIGRARRLPRRQRLTRRSERDPQHHVLHDSLISAPAPKEGAGASRRLFRYAGRVSAPVRSAWKRTAVAGLVILAILASVPMAVLTERQFFNGRRGDPSLSNIPYDGRFTFVRVKYTTAPGGYWAGGRPAWVHGFPLAEQNLMKIMNEVSYLGAHDRNINVLALDDPQLSRYPIAYIIEVGWWTLTDQEATALRAYMQKGGFVIVDDFKVKGWRGLDSGGWEPFEANMKRVLPEARFFEMEPSHPIFHSFFEINSLDSFPQAYNSGPAVCRGVF